MIIDIEIKIFLVIVLIQYVNHATFSTNIGIYFVYLRKKTKSFLINSVFLALFTIIHGIQYIMQ